MTWWCKYNEFKLAQLRPIKRLTFRPQCWEKVRHKLCTSINTLKVVFKEEMLTIQPNSCHCVKN